MNAELRGSASPWLWRASGLGAALVTASLVPAQVGDRAEIDRSAPPAHWEIPEAKVYSAAESLARFELPPGFRIEAVAAEPLVQDPIALQFDERGRLWVLEWPSYNWRLRDLLPGLEKLPPPKSRLVVLDDTDGDGRMDRRTVFLDDFDWPRGLQVAHGGALVLKLPLIVLARDTDGDGRADQQDVIVQGLEVPANPHGAQSNLLRGMDNWLYGSHFPQRLREVDGKWIAQANLSQRGQWGLSQDNFGRRVYASNGDHLRGDLVPSHYFTRNPNYPQAAGVDLPFPADQVTTPPRATPGVNRRAQLRDENGTLRVFTSNTAPTVYRGDQFPSEYVGNVFLGEVAGRFVRRSILTERDGTIAARNAYADREFLFARDERFRAVFTANGPDGALYVADMHRGVIEGDLFVTSYLRNQIVARSLQHPFFGMGRIFRIVHEGRPARGPAVLAREDGAGWVGRLAHPNGFWRDTAQRVLVERGKRDVVPALRRMARQQGDELARLHALWTLEGLQAIEAADVAAALQDPAVQVRVAAVRLAEPLLAQAGTREQVLARRHDERIEVRRQVMFTLGEAPAGTAEAAMRELLRRDGGQPILIEAALSGLRDREYDFLNALLGDPAWRAEGPGAAQLVGALAQAIQNSGAEGRLEALLAGVADTGHAAWARLAILDGLKGNRKPVAPLPAALAVLEHSPEDSIRSGAQALKRVWTAPVPAARSPRGSGGESVERGRTLFALCAACHGPEGKGQPTIAPPLEGSAVVAGAPEELLRSILLGRNLDRQNKAFPDMPSLAGLSDEDIAAIASYVRAQWGAGTRAVSVALVRNVRAAVNPAPGGGAPR